MIFQSRVTLGWGEKEEFSSIAKVFFSKHFSLDILPENAILKFLNCFHFHCKYFCRRNESWPKVFFAVKAVATHYWVYNTTTHNINPSDTNAIAPQIEASSLPLPPRCSVDVMYSSFNSTQSTLLGGEGDSRNSPL